MAQLDKTFPTNDCSMCIMAPKLVAAGKHQNIELITNAEIEDVAGESGNFTVKVRRNTLRVNDEKCTGCGQCAAKCPVETPDEYNQGMRNRNAIYVAYPQAVPLVFCIDKDTCIGCGNCAEVCIAKAVEYAKEDEAIEIQVGSVILCPGFEEFDARQKKEYGYGEFKNVVTSIEFERMLSATGPYLGTVMRPSDGEIPRRVAFIQCVGSRDEKVGNPYCSSVCCMYAIKEAIIAGEHTASLKPTIFFMDVRAFGKEFEYYRERAEKEYGVKMHRGSRVASVHEDPETKNSAPEVQHRRRDQHRGVRPGGPLGGNEASRGRGNAEQEARLQAEQVRILRDGLLLALEHVEAGHIRQRRVRRSQGHP